MKDFYHQDLPHFDDYTVNLLPWCQPHIHGHKFPIIELQSHLESRWWSLVGFFFLNKQQQKQCSDALEDLYTCSSFCQKLWTHWGQWFHRFHLVDHQILRYFVLITGMMNFHHCSWLLRCQGREVSVMKEIYKQTQVQDFLLLWRRRESVDSGIWGCRRLPGSMERNENCAQGSQLKPIRNCTL